MRGVPPFWGSKGIIGIFTQEGPSTNFRWPKVRRDSRVFLPRVHLIPQLLVRETASGFSWFESDVPPGGGIRGRYCTEKKGFLGNHRLLCRGCCKSRLREQSNKTTALRRGENFERYPVF